MSESPVKKNNQKKQHTESLKQSSEYHSLLIQKEKLEQEHNRVLKKLEQTCKSVDLLTCALEYFMDAEQEESRLYKKEKKTRFKT